MTGLNPIEPIHPLEIEAIDKRHAAPLTRAKVLGFLERSARRRW
jgi:hypothetical protein